MSALPTTQFRDVKHSEMLVDKDDAMLHHRTNRRNRPLAIAFAIVGFCYLLWTSVSRPQLFRHLCHGQASQSDLPSTQLQNGNALVPLEAHIMSKCPDATDCLRDLVLPTMQRVTDKVNFTLSYIGTPTDNDGVACMHGPKECMGNIIELCAGRLYPDPKIYLGFTMCLSRDYQEIPDESLVSDCALEHGIDISKLNDS
ncbi:gamma interferon inducible lysosomal thiol reductase [Diplocarpon rosae]|nr:gamma interferon inducible lysosomal thiol reductase [Diplocarpon rosae]